MRPVRFRRGGLHNLRDLHIDKNQVQRSPPRRPLLELLNIRLVECFAASQMLEGRGSRQDALVCLEHQIGPGTADARRAKRCTPRLRLAKVALTPTFVCQHVSKNKTIPYLDEQHHITPQLERRRGISLPSTKTLRTLLSRLFPQS